MRTSNREQIEAFLREHKGFSECIIEEFIFKDYGTTLEVRLNYVWSDWGDIRANLNEPRNIILKFRLVEDLHIKNSLSHSMLTEPESINWGLNEIALLKVVGDTNALQTPEPSEPLFTHVVFLWEGDRRIDIVFSEFEALSTLQPPGLTLTIP